MTESSGCDDGRVCADTPFLLRGRRGEGTLPPRHQHEGLNVATAKKGVVSKVKDAITGMFSDTPARKSPKRVAAGKKAAVTAKTNKAVKAVKKAAKTAVKKAAKAVTGAKKRAPAKKSR